MKCLETLSMRVVCGALLIIAVFASGACLDFDLLDDEFFGPVNSPSVGFESHRIIVEEDQSSVSILVWRSSGSVVAHYKTRDGTAQAGTDYVAKEGTLLWTATDRVHMTIEITLLDDSQVELDESFYLDLTSSAFVSRSRVEVRIIDDDSVPLTLPTHLDDNSQSHLFTLPIADVIRGVQDVNGDGYPDLMAGEVIYSGMDGMDLADSLPPALLLEENGIGDVNQDGHQDHAVLGADVSIYSGVKLPLSADCHSISLTAGGSQILNLDAGAEQQMQEYWILGYATDPLRPDAYTDFTISLANTETFLNSRGRLDAKGRAQATINISVMRQPSLWGLRLWHAYQVFATQEGRLHIRMTSNAVPLTLLP